MKVVPLHDTVSNTCTYIIYSEIDQVAVIIDPTDTQLERDLLEIEHLQLALKFIIETHVHADHVTSAYRLAELTGAKIMVPFESSHSNNITVVGDGDLIPLGEVDAIKVLSTPGHTKCSASFLFGDCLFTGDTLLIDGCGRTDLQGGDAGDLYDSVHGKLFTLDAQTIVWPGHDYAGRTASSIGWERAHNRRLSGRKRQEFISLMAGLNLPMPRLYETAVMSNLNLGRVQ